MKKNKYFILIGGFFILLFLFWFLHLKDDRENRLIKEGDALIEKIEEFKAKNNRLPNSLEEIGLEERDGIDVLYYDKRDSLNYTVSFGTSLGESKFYYSDNKQWEDGYRAIKNP
jgi:hypothetical protein